MIPFALSLAAASISIYFDPVDWPYIMFLGPFGIFMIWMAFYLYCGAFCSEANEDFKCKHILKFKGRFVLGVVLLLSLLVYFVKLHIAWISPIFIENVSYEQIHRGGIPRGGTDYSYRRLPRGSLYCECTITEKSFNDWVSSESRWENPTTITEENPTHIDDFMQKKRNIIVTDGIRVHYGKGKGGHAVFNRETNRVYYWTYY